jgi:chaperonin GroES
MSIAKRLVPLLDRVLVERVAAKQQTAGGILLPDLAQQRLNQGVVVSVGQGHRNKDGNLLPLTVKEGDKVLLPEYGGNNVKIGDKEYVLYRDEDILGILKD